MSLSGSPNSPHQGNMSFLISASWVRFFLRSRGVSVTFACHSCVPFRFFDNKKSRRGVDDLTSFCQLAIFFFFSLTNFFCFSFISFLDSLLQKWIIGIFDLLGNGPGDRSSIQSDGGSSSPSLSDDGNVSSSSLSSNEQKFIINKQNNTKLQINHHPIVFHPRRGQRTTSLSTSDEGIVMDYGEELPRKRKVSTQQFIIIMKKRREIISILFA